MSRASLTVLAKNQPVAEQSPMVEGDMTSQWHEASLSFGYNDEVVPPTSSYSTYNLVTAPKPLSVYQQTGHFWYQEQWDEWENWLLKQMGL